MRDVGAQPARSQPRSRIDALVALSTQNLARLEDILFADEQVDVAGIAQRGVWKAAIASGMPLKIRISICCSRKRRVREARCPIRRRQVCACRYGAGLQRR